MNVTKYGIAGMVGFLIAIPMILWIGTKDKGAIAIIVVVCVFVTVIVFEIAKRLFGFFQNAGTK